MSDDLSTVSDGLQEDDAHQRVTQLGQLSQGPPGPERGDYYRSSGNIAPEDKPRFQDWIRRRVDEAIRREAAKKQAKWPPSLSHPGGSAKAKEDPASRRHSPPSKSRMDAGLPVHVRNEPERNGIDPRAGATPPVFPHVPSWPSTRHNGNPLSRRDSRDVPGKALDRSANVDHRKPEDNHVTETSDPSPDGDKRMPPRDAINGHGERFNSLCPPKRQRPNSWSSNSSNGNPAGKPRKKKGVPQSTPRPIIPNPSASDSTDDAKNVSSRQISSNARCNGSSKPRKSILKPTSGVRDEHVSGPTFGYPAAPAAPGYIPRFIPPSQGVRNRHSAAPVSRDSSNGLIPPRSPSPFPSSFSVHPISPGAHSMYSSGVHPFPPEAMKKNHYRGTPIFDATPTYGGRPVRDPYRQQDSLADRHYPTSQFRPVPRSPVAIVPVPSPHGHERTSEAEGEPKTSFPDKWMMAKSRRLYDTERDPHILDPQRTSIHINPMLCYSNGDSYPLVVDLSNRRKDVTSVKPDARWKDEDILNQPATLPRVTKLTLISPKTPEPIEIISRGGVTVKDVLRSMFNYFDKPILWREFQGFSKLRQHELNAAYFSNARKWKGKPANIPKTFRQVDMLGEEPLFDGLHSDPTLVFEYMGESDAATLVIDFKSRMLID